MIPRNTQGFGGFIIRGRGLCSLQHLEMSRNLSEYDTQFNLTRFSAWCSVVGQDGPSIWALQSEEQVFRAGGGLTLQEVQHIPKP